MLVYKDNYLDLLCSQITKNICKGFLHCCLLLLNLFGEKNNLKYILNQISKTNNTKQARSAR